MKPTSVQNDMKSASGDSTDTSDLTLKINEQGNKVRDLKTKKASKVGNLFFIAKFLHEIFFRPKNMLFV